MPSDQTPPPPPPPPLPPSSSSHHTQQQQQHDAARQHRPPRHPPPYNHAHNTPASPVKVEDGSPSYTSQYPANKYDAPSAISSSVGSPPPLLATQSNNNGHHHHNTSSHRMSQQHSSLEDIIVAKDDQAERGLLHSMEQRRSQVILTSGGDAWHASVVGERPPLGGAVPLDRMEQQFSSYQQQLQQQQQQQQPQPQQSSSSSLHKRRESVGSRSSTTNASPGGGGGAPRLADIARRMRQKSVCSGNSGENNSSITNEAAGLMNDTGGMITNNHSATAGTTSSHRRAPSRAHALLDSIQEQQSPNDVTGGGGLDIFDPVGGSSGNARNRSDTATADLDQAVTHADHLLTGAMQVEDLFEDKSDDNANDVVSSQHQQEEPVVETVHDHDSTEIAGNTSLPTHDSNGKDHDLDEWQQSETIPLNHAQHSTGESSRSLLGGGGGGGSDRIRRSYASLSISQADQNPKNNNIDGAAPPNVMKASLNVRKKSAMIKQTAWLSILFWAIRNPGQCCYQVLSFLWFQTLLLNVVLPCFVLSDVFYYALRNPTWTFLPGHATVAWWLNFGGRQCILYEVARLWQWILIDKVILGTRLAVQCMGPLLTLCFIQARGWPFCIAAWGFLDLLLLEGSYPLASHWFWFNGVTMYSKIDSGSYILNSDVYIRLLFSMIVAGTATAVKRIAVAMFFGRRTFMLFKPRLEKLLKEVVLVSEVAALAEESELVAAEEFVEESNYTRRRREEQQLPPKQQRSSDHSVKFLGDVTWNNTPEITNKDGYRKTRDGPSTITRTGSGISIDRSDSDDNDDDDDEIDEDDDSGITQNDFVSSNQFEREDSIDNSTRVQGLLDQWEEPVNKADKSLNASISDILRFRRALTFMDDELMFGESFGPASTREQTFTSAQHVYNRLLMLTPDKHTVSCEFYDMLALEEDGRMNYKKRKALRKLFRPDKSNSISMLAFVQSCDALYKKLRYFRANVGNASVIDHALESIADGLFSFVLALVLLSVMRINPWPLLVSISTLLVSISFAVGNSAAKWFEGILLVAARRPYDLGDRIYMTDPSLINSDGLWYCWFVEDINLFHTTVRYAGTNEVATINNGSIANMRIICGSRSPNAAVWFQFAYRPNLMQDGNIDKIKAALEQYARDNPRDWHSFGYFRVDEVHPEIEKLVVTIGMQHRSAWQDLVRILEAKGAVMCWLMEYSRKLGVLYDELPKRELMYYAGNLRDGSVRQHRYQLHDPTNIANDGFNSMTPHPAAAVPSSGNSQPTAIPRPASDSRFLEQLQQSHG